MKKEFNYAIALTGGIATGKSTVSNLFKLYGFLIIDADQTAHKLLDKYNSDIAKLFGEEYVSRGKVNRKALGKIIFGDPKAKKRLEDFLHPLIKKDIIDQAQLFEESKKPYLIDIPLFFENKNYDIDRSICIYAPKDIQLKRIVTRDGFNKEEALQRIDSQMDIEQKKELATFVVDNTKDLKHLQHEVDRIIKEIL
jgi:dephospho-CoA kinase